MTAVMMDLSWLWVMQGGYRDPTFVGGRKRACIGRHKTNSERKKSASVLKIYRQKPPSDLFLEILVRSDSIYFGTCIIVKLQLVHHVDFFLSGDGTTGRKVGATRPTTLSSEKIGSL